MPSIFHFKTSERDLLSPNTSTLFRRLENVRQISVFFILYLLKYGFLKNLFWWIKICFRIEVRIRHFVLLRGVGFFQIQHFVSVNTCDYRGFNSCVTRGFNSKFLKTIMWHDEAIWNENNAVTKLFTVSSYSHNDIHIVNFFLATKYYIMECQWRI